MADKNDFFDNQSDYVNEVLKRISRALSGVKYGSITVTVHNGRVVQIEKSEKVRYDDDQYVVKGGGI
jgi:hypothetical protein